MSKIITIALLGHLARFWTKVRFDGPAPAVDPTLGACWLWDGATNHGGYGTFHVGSRPAARGCRPTMVHRLSWLLEHGTPATAYVCHRCDVRRCVRPSHLFEGTHAENMRDMAEKHRAPGNRSTLRRGDRKLNPDAVREIRTLAARGTSKSRIAVAFGVSRLQVLNVVRRTAWSHVA